MKLIAVTKRFPLREIIGEYTLLKSQGFDLYFTKDDNNHGVVMYRSIDTTRDVIEKNYYLGDPDDLAKQSIPTNCYGVNGIVADLLPEDLWVIGKGRRLVKYGLE